MRDRLTWGPNQRHQQRAGHEASGCGQNWPPPLAGLHGRHHGDRAAHTKRGAQWRSRGGTDEGDVAPPASGGGALRRFRCVDGRTDRRTWCSGQRVFHVGRALHCLHRSGIGSSQPHARAPAAPLHTNRPRPLRASECSPWLRHGYKEAMGGSREEQEGQQPPMADCPTPARTRTRPRRLGPALRVLKLCSAAAPKIQGWTVECRGRAGRGTSGQAAGDPSRPLLPNKPSWAGPGPYHAALLPSCRPHLHHYGRPLLWGQRQGAVAQQAAIGDGVGAAGRRQHGGDVGHPRPHGVSIAPAATPQSLHHRCVEGSRWRAGAAVAAGERAISCQHSCQRLETYPSAVLVGRRALQHAVGAAVVGAGGRAQAVGDRAAVHCHHVGGHTTRRSRIGGPSRGLRVRGKAARIACVGRRAARRWHAQAALLPTHPPTHPR